MRLSLYAQILRSPSFHRKYNKPIFCDDRTECSGKTDQILKHDSAEKMNICKFVFYHDAHIFGYKSTKILETVHSFLSCDSSSFFQFKASPFAQWLGVLSRLIVPLIQLL